MHQIQNQNHHDHNHLRNGQHYCLLIHVPKWLNHVGYHCVVAIGAAHIDSRFEPIPVHHANPSNIEGCREDDCFTGKINNIANNSKAEIFAEVDLLISNRINLLFEEPLNRQDEKSKPNNRDKQNLNKSNIVVPIEKGKVQKVKSFGDGKLAIIVMPTVIGPAGQAAKPKTIVPVAGFRKSIDIRQLIKRRVVIIEGYFASIINLLIASFFLTPLLIVKENKLGMARG